MDKAFENFKSWKPFVVNQTSKIVEQFRIDNGLEFFLEFSNTFYKDNDIARHQKK